MRKIILSIGALVILASCNNQNNSSDVTSENATNAPVVMVTDTANAAAFKFEKESYDFGQITEGEQVSYEFTFTNIGKSPLIISDAQATCGCTVPDYPRKPIAPGEEGKISVVFSSAGKTGMQNKVVSLIANTVPSKTELHLIGDVKPLKTK
ncbi:DUF1573 domain-containing protein [Daejeonella oryzae]|uniref:DUF1573 domain-containing protein n=1 Tax=Daejeonella oryzae TaxID=1122943 RepID=UPI000419D8DD|nr:DUF1573 domain-containing protein [Daejeonella oryzae]